MIPAASTMPTWKKVAIATTLGLALVTGVLYARTGDAMIVALGGMMVAAFWIAVGATRLLLARARGPRS